MTIDTSAAAIEEIKIRRKRNQDLATNRVGYESMIDIDTLLAALAERDAKLAAHDAGLAQVREEMPEVERIRERATNPLRYSDPEIGTLLNYIDTLKQNEARWRNARDVWEAERKRLQETVASLGARLADALAAREAAKAERDLMLSDLNAEGEAWRVECNELKSQLSASNAACAEMRESLIWHPMSSAPKDRNLLLARREPLSATYGYWYQPDPKKVGDCGGECRCPEYDDAGAAFWWSEDGGFTSEDPPTAWMLPPSPLAGQENDNG